jgi:Kef-type K+ transport system membrane component KefB
MNIIVIVALFGLMQAMRSFGNGAPESSIGTAVALGYLLLTGYFFGRVFSSLRLPKLTGYIVAGIVVGPAALGLVNTQMAESLKLVNGMAVALIALTAGAELELRAMRPLFRAIRWITLTGVIGTVGLLAIAVLLMRPWLPFLSRLSTEEAIAVAAMLGVVMVAQSPAVVVALKNELGAEGPVSRTVLGVVVIADLVVILMFAIASTIAKAVLGSGSDVWTTVANLAWELLGSLAVGAIVGYLLSIYLEKVRDGAALFLLTLTFIIAEVGQRLHFDPLLVALAAGMLIRNATRAGDLVQHTVEGAALPVYVLFFSVAGSTLHLDALVVVGGPAAVFVLVRAFGLLTGTRLGAWLAGAPADVRRYAGYGLLPQAGLAIALSLLLSKTFPEFGAESGALTLSIIAINEIFAPAIYRFALLRSGEVNARVAEPAQASSSGAVRTVAE